MRKSLNQFQPNRMMSSKGSRRSLSKQDLLKQEMNWEDNFSVKVSKNNNQVHHHYKEYFDKCYKYDVRGYL